MHASGVLYQSIGDWPATIDDLPVFDPAWIEPDAAARKQESRQAQPSAPRADHKDARRRARAHLTKTPIAIEGQGGDAHTFSVCCEITRGFDLSDEDSFDVLADWNRACIPPWSDDDLRAKIRNAREYGTELIGGRLTAFPLTEAGDAEHFAARYAGRVCYDDVEVAGC